MKTNITGLTNTLLALYTSKNKCNTEYVNAFCARLMKTISRSDTLDMPKIHIDYKQNVSFLWSVDETASHLMEFNLNFTHCSFYDVITIENIEYNLEDEMEWRKFTRQLLSMEHAEVK
jgi:hypothetical protein